MHGAGTARPTWRVRGATSRAGALAASTVSFNPFALEISPVFKI
jgi:hypothetical protein